ncbi:MAG: isoprenylcysteine carboxylmethyltransferase family protein [Kofleriaceae bacterium]|nr:isoprenylcysteine carboxylmethyltransferase family protein [Kofleriaceae bacterium]
MGTTSTLRGNAVRTTEELVRVIGSLIGTLLILAVILFVTAGSVMWTRGWWFLALFTAGTGLASAYIWRTNPELFAVRRSLGVGSKRWDLVLMPMVMVAFSAVIFIGALDDGRFHWAPQPTSVVAIGTLLFALAFALETWAQAVNRHFEPTVRIQTDRDHRVIDTGPYAYVRHPGYIAAVVLGVGMALSLGSAWALVPAGVLAAVLVVRTMLEDAMLQRELAGYADYARRVRFRWIPHVW